MILLCDNKRHLICVPYTIQNLHKMAENLNIKNVGFIKIIMIYLKKDLMKLKNIVY